MVAVFSQCSTRRRCSYSCTALSLVARHGMGRARARTARPVTVVPSLLGVAAGSYPSWRGVCEAVDAASAQRAGSVVLVGHSGAGPSLPAIAGSSRERWQQWHSSTRSCHRRAARLAWSAEFIDELSALATDDVVPPWSSSFGDEVMQDLVPDAARRARVEHDMPRLPLSFLKAEVPVPDGWTGAPAHTCSSPPSHTRQAPPTRRARGWPVAEIEGGKHLDPSARQPPSRLPSLNLERAMLAHP